MHLYLVWPDGTTIPHEEVSAHPDEYQWLSDDFLHVWTENEDDAARMADERPTCRHIDFTEDQDDTRTCLTCGLRSTADDRARIKQTIAAYDELDAVRQQIEDE